MRLQFSTKTLLLMMAVAAIACGGFFGWCMTVDVPNIERDLLWPLAIIPHNAALWTPIAFIAFVIGRRKLTVFMVVVLAILELIGIGLVGLPRHYV